jgi:hypothetical protein
VKSACGKVSRVRHIVPGGSRESLPERKVRFADHPGVIAWQLEIETPRATFASSQRYDFNLSKRILPALWECPDGYAFPRSFPASLITLLAPQQSSSLVPCSHHCHFLHLPHGLHCLDGRILSRADVLLCGPTLALRPQSGDSGSQHRFGRPPLLP